MLTSTCPRGWAAAAAAGSTVGVPDEREAALRLSEVLLDSLGGDSKLLSEYRGGGGGWWVVGGGWWVVGEDSLPSPDIFSLLVARVAIYRFNA